MTALLVALFLTVFAPALFLVLAALAADSEPHPRLVLATVLAAEDEPGARPARSGGEPGGTHY